MANLQSIGKDNLIREIGAGGFGSGLAEDNKAKLSGKVDGKLFLAIPFIKKELTLHKQFETERKFSLEILLPIFTQLATEVDARNPSRKSILPLSKFIGSNRQKRSKSGRFCNCIIP